MPTRRIFTSGIAAASASMLSSCGTILYPDRAHQQERSTLDPAIVILDGIGLLFGIIPGLVAFAVDFTTGAIYFPADHETGDQERTIFDRHETRAKPDQQEIERVLSLKTGKAVDLDRCNLHTMRIDSLEQFWAAHAQCMDNTLLASN